MAEPFKFDKEKFEQTKSIYVGILVALGIKDPNRVLEELANMPEQNRNGTMFNKWLENYFGNDENRKKQARLAIEKFNDDIQKAEYSDKMEELGFEGEVSPYVKGYLAEMTGNFIPYDTVLTAGVMVGEGNSLQMGCGEGKTGVLSMASYGILQNPEKQVFLTSSTSILAAEALDKLEFYEEVGLASDLVLITPTGIVTPKFDSNGKIVKEPNSKGELVCVTEEKKFEDMTPEQKQEALQKAYGYSLVVSDNATLMKHSMEGYLKPSEDKERVLLADEADFVLLDSYRPMQKKENEVLDRTADRTNAYEILQTIKNQMNPSELYVSDDSTQYVDFTQKGKKAVVEAIEAIYGNKPGVDKNEVFDFVYDALVVDVVYKENRDYQVLNNKNKIVSEDRASGVGIDLPEGIKQALEIKLKKEGKYTGEISPEYTVSNVTNVQSFFKEFFEEYQFISGTLGVDSQEIRSELYENFNLDADSGDVYEIPPKAKGGRIDRGKTLFATDAEKRTAIIKSALEEMKNGRPVLIGTISEAEIEALKEELLAQGYKKQPLIYTAASADDYLEDKKSLPEDDFKEKYGITKQGAPKDFAEFIKKNAGKKGVITLGTSIIGRGTTIKAKEVNDKNGIDTGIHVIIDGLHETSSRNQEQYKARTARGSDAGSTQEFFSVNDIPEITRKKLEEQGYDFSAVDQIDPDLLYRDTYKDIDQRTSSIRSFVVKFTELTREKIGDLAHQESLSPEAKKEVAALITARAFSIRNRACGVSKDFEQQAQEYEREITAFSELYVQKYRSPDKAKFDEKEWLMQNGYEDLAQVYVPFSKEKEEKIFTLAGLKAQAENARESKIGESIGEVRGALIAQQKENTKTEVEDRM